MIASVSHEHSVSRGVTASHCGVGKEQSRCDAATTTERPWPNLSTSQQSRSCTAVTVTVGRATACESVRWHRVDKE